jgi:hypothetical protein
MAFIPSDARWYIADVVLEHRIEDDKRNVVHINTMLVEASSPDDAYAKAMKLGKAAELKYKNTDGKMVRVRFRGLRELNVVHEPLEHGSELSYVESIGVPEKTIRKWVIPKKRLAVFAPIECKPGIPNYFSESSMKLLEEGLSRKELNEKE